MNLIKARIDHRQILIGETAFPVPPHLASLAARGSQDVLLGLRPEP